VPRPGREVDVQDISTVALQFSSGLLGLYGFWHFHDEAVLLLPVGLDVFREIHPEGSTELHSTMQNSNFHQTSENGLRVLPETTKIR
jgi:ankyrin repeat protein